MASAIESTRRPNGLLAMLSSKGLVRQSEVAVTQGIAWLCGMADGGNPLDALIRSAGLEPGLNPVWRAEVLAPDRTRTDLECWWGDDPRPHVVIEAKLGDELTEAQVRTYLLHLQERCHGDLSEALIGVLVPEYRRGEAGTVLDAVVGSQALSVRSAVWSYDQVLDSIEAAVGPSPDVEQLKGLIRVCEALDIPPFTESELTDTPDSRRKDLVALADRATAAIHPAAERLLPGGRDGDFEWRRYIEITPGGTNIAVGLPSATQSDAVRPSSPLWLRIHRDTTNAVKAGRALCRAYPDAAVTDETTGHIWLPLALPPHAAGAVMVSRIAEQIAEVMQVIGRED